MHSTLNVATSAWSDRGSWCQPAGKRTSQGEPRADATKPVLTFSVYVPVGIQSNMLW